LTVGRLVLVLVVAAGIAGAIWGPGAGLYVTFALVDIWLFVPLVLYTLKVIIFVITGEW
jgi:hypothetical protein